MQKTFLALALAAAAIAPAQAALTTGDLAFTSFNADEDGWAMVAFTEIAAGTKVYFSDNEWTGSAFNSGESYSSWTSGTSAIAAGTVIRFSNVDNATTLKASVGTFSRETVANSANWGVSTSEDTIYAYLGTSATAATTFLSAITTGTFGSATAGSLVGTGLANGTGAITLSVGSDYAEYNGARAGLAEFSDYKSLVSNVANWNDAGTNAVAAAFVPDTTAFTVAAAVPEPQTYAMLLAGLGAIGFVARRRAAK
ncbi:PEP-CTERM sorting domain-containing protein [Roseateles oligotrophus]|uniref:PEP-CTERM sorting domain-containing protein n=1 Tax=Roseateles oligotrophus TaxID=1769250 RepID=A0ABT2YM38_9BURK|nr:PEP-CTERM sorting domain-containing protein [Roseateles oligotrophus]MCV2371126.1 PEP-CTERM sorting domain-containing protein [Roseateles oligotrophus]